MAKFAGKLNNAQLVYSLKRKPFTLEFVGV